MRPSTVIPGRDVDLDLLLGELGVGELLAVFVEVALDGLDAGACAAARAAPGTRTARCRCRSISSAAASLRDEVALERPLVDLRQGVVQPLAVAERLVERRR